MPKFYCRKKHEPSVLVLCTAQPAQQLHGIDRLLGAATAEVHPVGVVVVVQGRHPLVPVHVALAVSQLCHGKGSRLELPRAGGWHGMGGLGCALWTTTPPRGCPPCTSWYL